MKILGIRTIMELHMLNWIIFCYDDIYDIRNVIFIKIIICVYWFERKWIWINLNYNYLYIIRVYRFNICKLIWDTIIYNEFI